MGVPACCDVAELSNAARREERAVIAKRRPRGGVDPRPLRYLLVIGEAYAAPGNTLCRLRVLSGKLRKELSILVLAVEKCPKGGL